jgi:signal transduction histidine kinase
VARKLIAYGCALGFAVLGVAAALLLQHALSRNFNSVLTIAVLLSAWLGGLGPGLLTGLLCTAAINYFFQDPPLELAVASVSDVVQLATFALAVVLLSSLVRSRERVRRESAQLVQLKTDFVNMVSHELRTPLAATRGAVDLLLEQSGDMTPRARRFLQTIRRSTERLGGLVNDLLELARLEAGRVELELAAEDPRRVVRDAIRGIQHQIRARHQHVRVNADADVPAVLADPRRLEQVLVNLLSNASKYSPRDSQLRVDIRGGAHSIDIIVSDSGPGLSPQDQRRVFEKFFRAGDSDRQREQPGTGLGLAIALSLVELQGGRLTVHSEPHKGASFCVSLPAAV